MTNKKKIMMKALIVAVMFFGCLLLWTGRVANILAILSRVKRNELSDVG